MIPAGVRDPQPGPPSGQPAEQVASWAWLEDQRIRRAIYIILVLELSLLVGFAVVYQPIDLNIYLWAGIRSCTAWGCTWFKLMRTGSPTRRSQLSCSPR